MSGRLAVAVARTDRLLDELLRAAGDTAALRDAAEAYAEAYAEQQHAHARLRGAGVREAWAEVGRRLRGRVVDSTEPEGRVPLRGPAYYDYVNSSPRWQARADAAKERAGWRCQLCNSPADLNAHHRTYVRCGFEDPDDLTVLCRTCHVVVTKYCPRPEQAPW